MPQIKDPTAPASEKQVYWVTKLVEEKQLSTELETEIREALAMGMTKGQGGKFLDVLFNKTTPNKAKAGKTVNSNPVTEAGLYQDADGNVFSTKKSQYGKWYAKKVTKNGFVYAPGKINDLTADMKMSPEQIAAFGVATGICANCSAALTDPISIFIGLGTQCGPNILGKEAYSAAKKNAKADPHVAHQLATKKSLPSAPEVKNEYKVQSPAQALMTAVEDKKIEASILTGGQKVPNVCAECSRKATTMTWTHDSSGIGGHVCPSCAKLSSVELSFA